MEDTDEASSSDCVVILPNNTTTDKENEPIQAVTENIKQPPYHTIRNVDAIYAYLSERVKDQPALYKVAASISAAINRSFMDVTNEDEPPKVHKLTLSGVSGSGKTQTVDSVRSLLGMRSGGPNEAQYVFIDGSTLSDETQVNNLTGAAPGLVGYQDGHSIADRLNRALNKPAVLSTLAARKKALTVVVAPYVPPRFVMLVIDELDKVSPDFLKAINGLIETGNYATPNNSVRFDRPPETSLIMMFTCNYGEEKIAQMALRNDEEAESFIQEAMRDDGVPPYTIGRLGDIFPYYALAPEALHELLGHRIEEHIQRTPLAHRFGKNKCIEVDDGVKRLLVENVLGQVNKDLGVRGAMKKLLRRVDLPLEKAFAMLTEMKHTGLLFDQDHALQVTVHRFHAQQLREDVVDDSWCSNTTNAATIIRSIKNNPLNSQDLALCLADPNQNLSIDVIGLRIGTTELCHFVMPVARPLPGILVANATLAQQEVKEVAVVGGITSNPSIELRQLRDTLVHIAQLVHDTNATKNDSQQVMERIKSLLARHDTEMALSEHDYTSITTTSHSHSEEEDFKIKKTKRVSTGAKEMTPRKRVKLIVDVPEKEGQTKPIRQGPKTKQIDGFTPDSYSSKTKRYLYRCNTCAVIVEARQTNTHSCMMDL